MSTTSSETNHRSGYVGIFGRPNTGKSTLLNQILGEKVSITSRKAQTTRNRVVGIHNTDTLQMVLVDTPGHHKATSSLNKAIVREIEATLQEVDAVLLMVDLVPAVSQAQRGKDILSAGEQVLLELCKNAKVPIVLGLNKVDLVNSVWSLPVIDAWKDQADFHAVIPTSALKGSGVDELMESLAGLMPEGPAYFPKDQMLDGTERFVVSELIREKLFHLLDQELPYSIAVQVEQFDEEERDGAKPRVHIMARILVERPSQKGIVIGKGGQMLKRIGTMARKDIIKLLGCSVHLELHVSCQPKWSENPRILRELGLSTRKV